LRQLRRFPPPQQEEKTLSAQVAQFLFLQYNGIIHRFDIGADVKLSKKQAIFVKYSLRHERGFPDLMIFEMRGGYGGLFIELKKDRDEVFTKSGDYRQDKHNVEQREFHIRLRKKGYRVEYGFGFKDTIEKIRAYMILDELNMV